MNPFISICIPAYKKPESLKKLLESIALQTYRNFEIIVSDDSNDDAVKKVVSTFANSTLNIHYQQNNPAWGMPANWNFAMKMATGEWIKIMHDDDCFTNETALQEFVNATSLKGRFIFSGYINFDTRSNQKEAILANAKALQQLQKQPLTLYAYNTVGPPSTTLIHRSIIADYDIRFRWRVDVEFYLRLLLKNNSFHYIPKPLISIGLSDTQITQTSINNPVYEIPELFLLLKMYNVKLLQSIRNYDTVWRTLRNTGIKNKSDLKKYVREDEWPNRVLAMLAFQNRVPSSLLAKGIVSKPLMLLSYLLKR